MCGRYSLVAPIKELETRFVARFKGETETFQANDNIAPTQDMLILTSQDPGTIQLARWGLVPAWAKDISIGNKMTNARAETLEEKPSFRNLIHSRRCLVPADGFYEWKPEAGGKQPYRIAPEAGGLLAFAGLYDVWKQGGESLLTYTIITTAAHGPMSNIHERMPLILSREQERQWINPRLDKALLQDIIEGTPRISLSFAPVSKAINKVKTGPAAPTLFDYYDRGSE